MTYEEFVEGVAKDTADTLEALYDDGVGFDDLDDVIKAGTTWNAALKVPGISKKTLIMHVIARMPKYVVGKFEPLPTGEIPPT